MVPPPPPPGNNWKVKKSKKKPVLCSFSILTVTSGSHLSENQRTGGSQKCSGSLGKKNHKEPPVLGF